ncbi:iron-containing redox enzyme family protein [Paraburkholderia sp. LEh10]|uniref:iron-containing redox enzyme family protein n=1 Tax=Paraburkholderia sp. LEh10 TaxID=2821353 RepID=UPI0028A9E134|nr:iron-containing redox enzyme family protein [Paraburkholderia sp. LEh10]
MIDDIFEPQAFVLAGKCLSTSPLLVIEDDEHQYEFPASVDGEDAAPLISALRSGIKAEEVLARHSPYEQKVFDRLKELQLVRAVKPALARSGLDVLLELEDLANELLYCTLYKNVFWEKCASAATRDDIPLNVVHGMIVENYHFLFRESYFDAPVLSYVANTGVRLAMNEFYAEEYGHDELLLKALTTLGVTREDLACTVPLPQTMALCNALAYWAHSDPLFFFSTLGILEGKDIKQDSFLDAAYRIGVDPALLKPVKAHSDINLHGGHGSLTRKIFSRIPAIADPDVRRMRAQTHLFIELYDQFYTGIWEHYSTSPALLRKLDVNGEA